jgi:lipoate-protein ligase A
MLNGRKIAGGAQKRSRGYLLHQGSIAWDVLSEASPDLSERDFSECFANQIAQLFVEEPSALVYGNV